ncbi:MAG: hypothetical protein ABSB74_19065 [Tepidisphaeraceae bacterium]
MQTGAFVATERPETPWSNDEESMVIKTVRQAFNLKLAMLIIFGAMGCSAQQKSLLFGESTDVPQSQAVDWGSAFKLRITKCSWEGSQLVIGLSMTYSGNDPAVPGQIPVFQLESSDNKHFDPSNGAYVGSQLVNTNYNPGSSVNTELTFAAPHSDYKFLVENGGETGGQTVYWFASSGPVVYVWSIQPNN